MYLRCVIAGALLWLLAGPMAYGQILTSDLEIKLVPNVGAAWQTIALENSYTDAIVVCTYNLPSSAAPPAVTRIQNIGPTSFQLRIQQFENSNVVTASDVHCIIADEGAYNSGGLKYEARKVISEGTNGQNVAGGWSLALTENVTGSVTQSYANPHVIGQVMSFRDARASTYWDNNCTSRTAPAFNAGPGDGICVGKQIGQINSTRLDEMLGYIVIEAGTGTVNDITWATAVGPDFTNLNGVGNAPPYSHSPTGDFDIGVVSLTAMDGGHGGWAVLYGADPLPPNTLHFAIDEETVAGDMTRTHTGENVAYWVFDDNQAAKLDAAKSVTLFSGNTSNYSIPGSDVIYTIKADNSGTGPVDNNSIFFVDAVPQEVTFYNGDIDDGGPLTGVIDFNAGATGLTFNEATDLRFSNGTVKPTDISGCNYSPAAGYDPAVTFICFAPKGTMSEGTITGSTFTASFRAAIK